ncbi:MAG: hypothetical protein LQ339_006189 [Xanthoria mediterranea]|nr:MAG: hypothetical protein LQ339_006189 [Xanthoria mediterranea]
MDPHHRKIDLQSPADLTYLHTNIKHTAQQKLDLAIPASATPANEPDNSFRPRVQQILSDYITQTLTLALPSLAINGLEAETSMLLADDEKQGTEGSGAAVVEDESHYEAYDPRLAERLRTLYRQLEWEHTRVAELRRDAPGAAARGFVERLEAVREVERGREKEVEVEMEGVRDGGLGGVGVERGAEVEKIWGRGLEGLVELGRVTEVVAKMERAKRAAEVVEGM